MRAITVLVVVSLVGCTADGDTTILMTHDACAPFALVAAEPTAVQAAGIERAGQLWHDFGAPAIGLRAGATVEVRFQPASLAFRGYYDDEQGLIYINDGLVDETTLGIVIAHEVGHAFGLLHVTDRPSVMSPGNLTTPPNADDQRALEALWGPCQVR